MGIMNTWYALTVLQIFLFWLEFQCLITARGFFFAVDCVFYQYYQFGRVFILWNRNLAGIVCTIVRKVYSVYYSQKVTFLKIKACIAQVVGRGETQSCGKTMSTVQNMHRMG